MIHTIKSFEALSAVEVYDMLQLRQEVFVIEQQCIYQDADDKDRYCHHLLVYANQKLIAYCRLVPPGISYAEASIGRVCTARQVRMEGAGLYLMQRAMEAVHTLWPNQAITISAQAYLEKFYQKFGFMTVSEPYLEDDIPHIKMICAK